MHECLDHYWVMLQLTWYMAGHMLFETAAAAAAVTGSFAAHSSAVHTHTCKHVSTLHFHMWDRHSMAGLVAFCHLGSVFTHQGKHLPAAAQRP